tara:strand:+ start:1101 stop:2429 length:1329 start_codon:yes stop_codon:yes gene_type:complete
MAWGKLSSNSITVAGDTLTGDSFTTSKFIQYLGHLIPETSNNTEMFIRPNNNSNTVYANRKSVNGGTDVTAVSQTEINSNGDNVPTFQVIYFINILGEEKLGIHFETSAQETGAGTAPSRREQVDKFVPSPDVDITSFTGINTRASANLGVDTNISALGTDITPAAAIPFAENAQVGSRAEITDTRKMYHKVDTVTGADISLSELKAYWKFNETSGDIVNQSTSVGSTDSLGTGADLQVTGATYNNSNTPFNTMNFDGTNDVAIAGTSLSQFNFMHNGGKWTVSMWASINSITDEGLLFSNQTGTNTYSAGILQGGDGSFTFRVYDSGIWVDRNLGSPGLVAGTMYLLTFTFDKDEATDKATFYRNAVEIATGDQRIAQGTSSNATTKMGVGAGGNSANWLGCKVAEMSIWNRILTDAEITTLYNSGSGKVIDTNTWKEEGT